MKETPFKNKVKKFLDDYGAWYIKYWAGSKFTKEGIPDMLACINGRFYGMELKGDDGHPSLLQLRNLNKIHGAGGIGVLLYPKDFRYFVELINDTEIGKHWYRENRLLQKKWYEKLNR